MYPSLFLHAICKLNEAHFIDFNMQSGQLVSYSDAHAKFVNRANPQSTSVLSTEHPRNAEISSYLRIAG